MYVELFLAVFLEKYAFSDSISSAEYALIEHGNFYFRKTFETYPSKKLNIKLKLSISFFTKYAILLGMKLIFFMKINFQNILNSFTSLFISFNSRETTQFPEKNNNATINTPDCVKSDLTYRHLKFF